jgi:hypothetical protein
MKKLNETPIGNIQPNTFRPTEAEKLILLNVVEMIDQGRSVTQQDAINVPKEKLEELDIGDDNIEQAFTQLVKLKLIQVNPDQTITISPTGQPVVEELKKAEQQAELTSGDETKTDTGELPPNPMGQDSTIQGQSPMPSMEGFGLIKHLNDMSNLMEVAKKFVK